MNSATSQNTEPLLHVEGLCVRLVQQGGRAAGRDRPVLDKVSLAIRPGQTFGLVGESGSGKSTLARAIVRLIPAASGRVWFDGLDVFALGMRELRALRRGMQLVFQDPGGSLNPRLTVEMLVGEAMRVHGLVRTAGEQRRRVIELLDRVGLPADCVDRYPHEFSGGQRQRIGIARALAVEPRLLICDEPTSALDVCVQAQILALLKDVQRQAGLTILFISHSLAVVRWFCDEIAVLFMGQIVERGPAAELFERPQHSYTRTLLKAVLEPVPPASSEARTRTFDEAAAG
jgi:ABC-type glutathione transport system ATPase component